MKVKRLNANDSKLIEDFLKQQEFLPIQQTLVWGEFQNTLGLKSFRVGVESEGKLIAYTQIFEKKLPFAWNYLQIQRGFLINSKLKTQNEKLSKLILDEIENLAKERNSLYVRFDFQKDLEVVDSRLREAKEENFPLATTYIDLTQSEENILKAMKQKGRYNIRIAQKHGVKVEEMNSKEGVETFYKLLKKTTSRDGFSSHPKSYYQKLLEKMGENASLLVASHEGIPLASIILTFGGDCATYYYGSSNHEFRKYMGAYLIQFEAMKLAKSKGYKFYDFLGISPIDASKHHLKGVSDFKLKFGGEIIEYPKPKEMVMKPFFYKLFKLAKKLR